MDALIRKILYGTAVLGTIYHLYLVLHPYLPFPFLRFSIFDLTQVQRATHVFLIAFLGYLMNWRWVKKRGAAGSFPLAALTSLLVVEFYQLDLPFGFRAAGVLVWAATMLPSLVPRLMRPSNLACALLCFLPFVYLVSEYETLIYRAILPEPWDLLMALCEVLLVLGVIFRLSGPIMPVFVMVFILYNLYGDMIPGPFSNPGFSLDMLLGKMYCETEAGIFGTITGVSLKYLIYFTTLGAVISKMDFGRIIANIALLFVGRSPASPGRTSSIMAVLMGMFSGSGAADTQFVATLTRSLYDRVGYERLVAAGIIATVGSIAYITPPVMGSISFIMVELLAIPYSWIITMAIGPMLLYLLGIAVYNELYVRRKRLQPMELDSGHDFAYFRRYAYVFAPIALIIALIYRGYSINITVSLAALLFLVFAYADPTVRPPLQSIPDALAEGILHLLPIASAVIAANMIMSMMVLSGLASKFSLVMMKISGSSLLLATAFTGIFSLILGMGVPPIATYVLTSALTAPTIQQLAVVNGIPEEAALLATHMFLFYYAVLAEVTPPVALSAYAAAAVMNTDPVKTGVFAARVAVPKYLVGIIFILTLNGTGLLIIPALQALPPGEAILTIGQRYLGSGLAIVLLNAAVVGWFLRNLSRLERSLAGAASLLLFYPSTSTDAVGLLLAAALILKAWAGARKRGRPGAEAG
ncbi:MAG: TRAP transporter fused permease subunit [Desulfobacterales bacterium]